MGFRTNDWILELQKARLYLSLPNAPPSKIKLLKFSVAVSGAEQEGHTRIK